MKPYLTAEQTITCGEAIIRLLEAYGIKIIFGIPGVHNVELYRGLEGASIRHITPRHEQGAGFMADGYARATGKVAACFTVTGPGLTNILTAMGQAYADSIPMLVISTVNPVEKLGVPLGSLHELRSQRSLAAEVSAYSQTILHPAQLSEAFAQAMALFSSSRPRPVYLEIPVDVISTAINTRDLFVAALPTKPVPPTDQLDRAAHLLAQVEKPLVILGGGAIEAADHAKRFVELLNAPTILTVNGRGILASDHPLLAGENLGAAPLKRAFKEADIIVAVGTELGETEMYPLPVDLAPTGKMIRIDIDHEQLTRRPFSDIPLLGDAAATLAALNERMKIGSRKNGDLRAKQLRDDVMEALPVDVAPYQRLMQVMEETLPDAVYVGDSAQTVYATNQFYRPSLPRSLFNSSTGYGTLGYSLPAAIGAKLGLGKSRPVVSLMGDGGILFTIGELASAVEACVPLIILLWNNDGYGEIRNYMQEKNITPISVNLYVPDFITIARGFGCHAVQVNTLEDLTAELADACKRNLPTLIEIRQDSTFLVK